MNRRTLLGWLACVLAPAASPLLVARSALAQLLKAVIPGMSRFAILVPEDNPAAMSTARIMLVLRGAKPGNIPFELPESITLVVNRATASRLGIKVSCRSASVSTLDSSFASSCTSSSRGAETIT